MAFLLGPECLNNVYRSPSESTHAYCTVGMTRLAYIPLLIITAILLIVAVAVDSFWFVFAAPFVVLTLLVIGYNELFANRFSKMEWRNKQRLIADEEVALSANPQYAANPSAKRAQAIANVERRDLENQVMAARLRDQSSGSSNLGSFAMGALLGTTLNRRK